MGGKNQMQQLVKKGNSVTGVLKLNLQRSGNKWHITSKQFTTKK
jgi:hypothetical protein